MDLQNRSLFTELRTRIRKLPSGGVGRRGQKNIVLAQENRLFKGLQAMRGALPRSAEEDNIGRTQEQINLLGHGASNGAHHTWAVCLRPLCDFEAKSSLKV